MLGRFIETWRMAGFEMIEQVMPFIGVVILLSPIWGFFLYALWSPSKKPYIDSHGQATNLPWPHVPLNPKPQQKLLLRDNWTPQEWELWEISHEKDWT